MSVELGSIQKAALSKLTKQYNLSGVLMMSYDFPSDIAQQLQAHIATGDYASPDEVLRDAMAALAERKDDLSAIEAGVNDMEAGNHMSLAEADAALRKKYNIPPGPLRRRRWSPA